MYSKIPGINILKLTWASDGMDFEEHWSHSCLWVPWIRLMKQIAGFSLWLPGCLRVPGQHGRTSFFRKESGQPHSQTLMEKIPFWGFLRRDLENPVGPEKYDQIWKDERWNTDMIENSPYYICITDHRSFVIMQHYFKALSTSNQSRLQFNHLNFGCFDNVFFSNTFNRQDSKGDNFSQEIRFQKKTSSKWLADDSMFAFSGSAHPWKWTAGSRKKSPSLELRKIIDSKPLWLWVQDPLGVSGAWICVVGSDRIKG